MASSLTARARSASSGGAAWYRRLFGIGARDSDIRPARDVWNNPVAWREAAARANTPTKLLLRWAFILLGTLWGIGIVGAYHFNAFSSDGFRLAFLATVYTELAVVTLIAINMSATAISREREDGTLDLLLTTPLSQADYLNGKLRGLISYLLPLLAVPVVTTLVAGLYVLVGGFDRRGGVTVSDQPVGLAAPVASPVVLPEAAILLPLATVPFLAFVIMIGLQWSLKSRGTISSVVATVALVGVVAGVVGLCGASAGQGIPVVGPALTALNPFTLVYSVVQPVYALTEPIAARGLFAARLSLAVGAGLAVVVYAVLVFSFRAALVRTFDVTTRKLAGAR